MSPIDIRPFGGYSSEGEILRYLRLKSDYMPKIIGGLIALAGFAYIVDALANSLLSNYGEYERYSLGSLPSRPWSLNWYSQSGFYSERAMNKRRFPSQ